MDNFHPLLWFCGFELIFPIQSDLDAQMHIEDFLLNLPLFHTDRFCTSFHPSNIQHLLEHNYFVVSNHNNVDRLYITSVLAESCYENTVRLKWKIFIYFILLI